MHTFSFTPRPVQSGRIEEWGLLEWKSDSPGCKARGIEEPQLFNDGDEFKSNSWLNLSET
jgi:hypothetical protein